MADNEEMIFEAKKQSYGSFVKEKNLGESSPMPVPKTKPAGMTQVRTTVVSFQMKRIYLLNFRMVGQEAHFYVDGIPGVCSGLRPQGQSLGSHCGHGKSK